jgi:2',3'-cyclic-nucleotide 2'-phosphodiesterase (5'-nucleotidase family)
MSWIAAWMLSALSAAAPAGPAPKDVTLLLWSDLHGDPSPHLFAWVDSLRRKAEAWNHPVLALDGGEAFFGSDLSHATGGESMVRVLNLVKPDAIVLGQQDFLWSRVRTDTLMAGLKVPVLTSNLRNALDDQPYGRKEWIVRDFGGLKVGLVGVVEADLAYSDRPVRVSDLRSEDPGDRVRDAVEAMRQKGGAKLAIAISHAGAQADEDLARAVPDLDLIAGSRDGEADTLYKVGKVWIARFRKGASQVRKVELDLDDSGVSAEASSLPVPASIAEPSSWKASMDSIERSEKIRMDSTVGNLAEAWPKTKREGSLGNFLADALRTEAGVDVGLWPGVGIHAGLPRGRVTREDLNKVFGPFGQVSVFELPGSELRKMVKYQFFHATDFLFVSGLSCSADNSQTGGAETQVLVGGKPIQGGEHYKIAIPQSLRDDIYALTGFSLESASPEYLERWDRDVVLEHIRHVGLKTSLGRVPSGYGASK